MPQIKSAIKRVRQQSDRTAQNKQQLSKMRTAMKKFEKAAAENADNASELLSEASRQLDKTVQKGIIHKNQANREKSRLAKKLHA